MRRFVERFRYGIIACSLSLVESSDRSLGRQQIVVNGSIARRRRDRKVTLQLAPVPRRLMLGDVSVATDFSRFYPRHDVHIIDPTLAAFAESHVRNLAAPQQLVQC
jgi:hypothetical protein